MLNVHLVLEVYLKFVFNWLTFGLWFFKLIFKTCYIMGLKCFSRKWAQEVEFWGVECLVWAWEANLEIPDFGFLARAKDSSLERPSFVQSSARANKWWLERKFQALRILVHADARSCEGTYAWAKPLILEARSSEGRLARARSLFSATFESAFQLYFCILISS